MIATKAIESMIFPLLGLTFLTILFVSVLLRSTRWSLGRRLGIMVLCVVGGSYLISGAVFHLTDYSQIKAFRQEDLAEVRIGARVLTSPGDIGAVCSALKSTEWFESRHGGWGEEVPLVFKTASGRETRFRVAYYKVQAGAVILHRIGGDETYMLGDVGFNSKLPEVLTRLGVSLPGAKPTPMP